MQLELFKQNKEKTLKVLELFGGIGAPKKALTNLNIKHKILNYVEWDKNAVNAYNLIHNQNEKPEDIRQFIPDPYLDVDLVWNSSPCQSLSIAGKGEGANKGSNTESSFVWEVIRIVKTFIKRPKVIIWENVMGLISKKHIHTLNEYIEELNELGYESKYQALNAIEFGIPQKRKRVFVVSIHKDSKYTFDFNNLIKTKTKPLSAFLEKQVDKSYSIKQLSMIKAIKDQKIKIVDNVIQTNTTKQWRWNSAGVIKIPFYNFQAENYVFDSETAFLNTITATGAQSRLKIALPIREYKNFFIWPRASDGKLINGAYNRAWKGKFAPTLNVSNVPKIRIDYNKVETLPVFEINDKPYHIRVLTPKESIMLMGFSEEDYEKIAHLPKSKIYKVAGNSIVVQVLEAIFKELFDEFKKPLYNNSIKEKIKEIPPMENNVLSLSKQLIQDLELEKQSKAVYEKAVAIRKGRQEQVKAAFDEANISSFVDPETNLQLKVKNYTTNTLLEDKLQALRPDLYQKYFYFDKSKFKNSKDEDTKEFIKAHKNEIYEQEIKFNGFSLSKIEASEVEGVDL